MGQIVRLGEITCPSGQLVVIDGGMLGMWSGHRSPGELDPAGLGIDPGLTPEVRGAVDFEIVGADAEAAGASFGVYPGRYHYDVPATRSRAWVAEFARHCEQRGWSATMVPAPEPVPHRERARRCADEGLAGFLVFGLPAIAINVPSDRPLAVEAEGASGEWDEWARMTVRAPVAAGRPLGPVGVDAARFAFADAEALGSWEHQKPLDGRADVVFWGADAAEVAAHFQAGLVDTPGDDGSFGWVDLPVAEAVERGLAVKAYRDGTGQRMAVDFRPHSHHYQVMRLVRGSENEAGVITVAGAQILFAMTSIGDGIFPARADATGIHIELSEEDDEGDEG